jgi:hypothetical protein
MTCSLHADVCSASTANLEEDFLGYNEEMKQRQRNEEMYAAKLEAHEIWRQTTWGGWAVRTIQGFGSHIAPFVSAMIAASNEEGTGLRVVTYVGFRMLVVIMGILTMYSLLKVFQLFIGTDVTVVEEVVVVHEYDTEEEAAKARAEQKSKSRSKTSKATKSE